MSKRRRVIWTENAVENLLSIKEYILQDSPDRAESWILELYNSGESLVDFPGRGRIVPEFNQESLRELIIENYRLVYRLGSSDIEIVAVFEGHRQLKKKDVKK